MPQIWKHALESVRRELPTVLVAVVDCSGSVPGKTGAKMVVSELGCAGTIGGGIAESQLIERARSHRGEIALASFQHTPEHDSLCAGAQTLALVPLDSRHLQLLEAIRTGLADDGFGSLQLSPAGITFTSGRRCARSFTQGDAGWRYQETIGKLDTLYIVGGGHVSLALSRVMATLPFRTVVLDNREQLPTMLENSFAHETRVIDYQRVSNEIPDGEQVWVIIMTHGHRDDEAVLERLLGRSFRYLGMMGSPVKVRQIFANIEGRGGGREQLDQVRAPVGLAIGSHSPEEIAISIAAEIIKLRNTTG